MTPFLNRDPSRLYRQIAGICLLLGLAGLDAGCASYGRRMVLPTVFQGRPESVLPPAPGYEIVPLQTKDGTRIVGQFGRAEFLQGEPSRDPAHVPTVIFLYGASQHLNAPHDQRVFGALRDMGVNVFIPEYPGNGMSEGSASESQCYATADAALDYLLSRTDIDHARIIVAGQSLGSGPAFDLASRRELAGLISVGGFTKGADAAMNATGWMPRWLANSLTAEVRFDNLSKVKSIRCPILLVYGLFDTLVPPWMADRLAAAAIVPVTKLPVPSSHNSLWNSPYLGLNAQVRDWMHAR